MHIVLPALRHSILAGLIIVAALSIGEFQFSNLVAGFLNRTYPVVLLQAFYGATGFACAATVILLALALVGCGRRRAHRGRRDADEGRGGMTASHAPSSRSQA